MVGTYSLPRTKASQHKFDIVSAALSAATFGLLIGAIDALGHGESYPLFLAEVIATLALGYFLVRRQLSLAAPLLPVDLLKIPIFTLSVSTSISSFVAQMLALVSLPFLFQNELHFTAVETGLLITPWPIAIGLAAPLAGRLSDRYSAGILGGAGLFCFAMGLLSFAFLPDQPGYFDLSWRMALCGFGFGIFQSPNNRAMLSAAPKERSGGASGMLGTARLLGQTTGAALAALLFARLPHQAPTVGLLISSGFALVGALVSLARLYDISPAAAQRASNPEADPSLHATLLRSEADQP
jgi:DHA2 family multidrug resistance protein-like MFS transporter